MTDHTTHFDDCGCKSKALEAVIEERSREAASTAAERDTLRLRVAALEAALDDARKSMHRLWDAMVVPRTYDQQRESEALKRVQAALSGDTTALRAMLVEAATLGQHSVKVTAPCPMTTHYSEEADAIADRILGASKGGGE